MAKEGTVETEGLQPPGEAILISFHGIRIGTGANPSLFLASEESSRVSVAYRALQ